MSCYRMPQSAVEKWCLEHCSDSQVALNPHKPHYSTQRREKLWWPRRLKSLQKWWGMSRHGHPKCETSRLLWWFWVLVKSNNIYKIIWYFHFHLQGRNLRTRDSKWNVKSYITNNHGPRLEFMVFDSRPSALSPVLVHLSPQPLWQCFKAVLCLFSIINVIRSH